MNEKKVHTIVYSHSSHTRSINRQFVVIAEGQRFPAPQVRDTIALDLERLHPGDDFYSAADVQSALLNVLLVWSLENPSVGYRQGMHELASLVLSQRANDANSAAAAAAGGGGIAHVWGKGTKAPTEPVLEDAPELAAAYVEHDTYAMFSALMARSAAGPIFDTLSLSLSLSLFFLFFPPL